MQSSTRVREWILVALIGVTAVLANLPQPLLDRFSIERNFVTAVLVAEIFIALFSYPKFQVFFLIVLLAVAANNPGGITEALGVSTLPLIITLALIVGMSIINHLVALLPTGLEQKPRQQSAEGIKVLFYAIEKGNLVYAQKILAQNIDPNMVADNGYTPLMYACARGDVKMVELLLRNGADVNVMSKDGDTAMELALRTGSQQCADLLKIARAGQVAREAALKAQAAR